MFNSPSCWTFPAPAGYHGGAVATTGPVMRALLILTALFLVSACSLRAPEIDWAMSAQSRSADWPALVPLGPLLAGDAALTPRSADIEGRSLQWRAADLRRRAALLRAVRLD